MRNEETNRNDVLNNEYAGWSCNLMSDLVQVVLAKYFELCTKL